MYTVTSEIYKETNFRPTKSEDGKVVSEFEFKYPDYCQKDVGRSSAEVDNDGDLLVTRRKMLNKESQEERRGVIKIQHSEATEIRYVGLQVWRGALLLADFLFDKRNEFKDKQLLELGAGVGLTSIAAALYVKSVVCTDVDIVGILDLIRGNISLNSKLCDSRKIKVMEYDFMKNKNDYTPELCKAIDESDIVVAADVIYDDDLTNAFIQVVDAIFEREKVSGRPKEIYVALEKRYVFTMCEFDAVAPMFEYFIKQTLQKPWRFEYVETNFPQYFDYDRCKHLVLFKITRR